MSHSRKIGERTVRFGSFLDSDSERFEQELRSGPQAVELSLWQSHLLVAKTNREFLLFQSRDPSGRPAAQYAVYVARSRLYGGFALGSVPRMGRAISDEEERFAMGALKLLCAEAGLMTLRLQPLRLEPGALDAFEKRASGEGYTRVTPNDVTRTLILDVKQTPEEFLGGLRSKTRSAFKHRSRDDIVLEPITDLALANRCRDLEREALKRTGGGEPSFDFGTHIHLARENPDRALALGLFLKKRPGDLLAFSTAVRHGSLAEYCAAGSAFDAELRAIPFNYFLIWELFCWARAHGATQLDLGGVTPGGPDDPLEGISRFKRYLCDNELEVGREMLAILSPPRYLAYRASQAFLSRIRR